MAQVQQVTSSLNGGVASEKNGNGLTIGDESSSSTATALLHPNGSTAHLLTTPTKDHGGASTSIEAVDDLQLSPGDLRRRSTRASALKAQEKIKLKDDIVQGPQKRMGGDDMENSGTEDVEMNGGSGDVEQKGVKKRKLEGGGDFDQTCFRFGLRANDDGEVYAMTDESENSSIHESEMEVVRYHYEKMKNREPDEEQLRERLKMRREAENALREEETKLLVLRKMKDSQGRAINKLAAETKAADIAEAQAAAAAYRPVQAGKGGVTNGKNMSANNSAVNKNVIQGLANLTIQQQLDLLQKISTQSPAAKAAYQMAKKNPAQTTQIFMQLITMNSQQQMEKQQKQTEAMDLVKQQQNQGHHQGGHHQQAAHIVQSKLHQQTPAQRAAAARMAFRTQADKQLMTIPLQKQQQHDITFLPNPNASAFLLLHGLDQVVQAVLKDRDNDKPYTGPAYECEECHTDCAHTWKAIGSTQDDLHLYCENCVRSAQKRKNRTDQTNLLKRAFQKISLQEKEFEKKIADGQLEQFVEQKPAPATPMTSSTATVSSTPLPHSGVRLSNMPSSSGTSTPTHAIKTSTPLPSTPKSSSSASKKAATSQQQQQAQMQMMQSIMRNPQMMQQMAQMMMLQQAAGINMQSMMAAQAMQQAQQAAQAQAAQQAAAAARAQAKAEQAKREKELAAQQAAQQAATQQKQQQQQLVMAIMQLQSNPQMMAQLSKMTPQQQKDFQEYLLKGTKK